jgi:serine/threonine-protein kinase
VTAQLASQLQDALGSDYRVEQELAGGGMSRLFLATDLRHGRRVVVKVLSPELVSTESTARFKREIELTVRLQHPHILPILTSGSWEDVLYYITPFIPGESLKARIERDRKLPLDDIVKILRDASGALAFAHQHGIVHRDVKPGNILLAEGHAILADFGIARAMVTNATPLTGSGMAPGTPAYMAPELPTDE